MPCGTWDLPGPGMELMYPALAGGVLATGPPGKSYNHFIHIQQHVSPKSQDYVESLIRTALLVLNDTLLKWVKKD